MGKMSDLDLQIKELRSCGGDHPGNRRNAGGDLFFPRGGGYAAKGSPQRKAENAGL